MRMPIATGKTKLAVAIAAAGIAWAASHASAAEPISVKERVAALAAAYPDVIRIVDDATISVGGKPVAVDDGRQKSHAEKLVDPDVEDMLSQIYPIGACWSQKPPERNFDPGRIRNDTVMRAIFGSSEAEVRARLVRVPWFGATVMFTRTAGADAALAAVAADLAKLPARYGPVFKTTAGTFNARNSAGTSRLSVHSFAAAIDVNTKYADYWRWSGGKPGNVPKYVNKVPKTVVDVFERHGFVWGGKWYHYDTMHFEYRPELIAIARLAEQRGCPD